MSMSISGLISGMDTDALITQLMALERKPITLMQQRQSTLEAQKNAWRDINSRLKAFDSRLSSLKLESTYLAKSASSGDEDILTASAGSTAAAGTYEIKVNRLATGQSQHSKQVADATKALSAKGQLQISDSEGKTWIVDAGQDDSLQAIAKKVNATFLEEEGGVKAYVPVNATVVDNRLVLSSKTTGSSSWFRVGVVDAQGSTALSDALQNTDPLDLHGTEFTVANRETAAQNGEVYINGLEISNVESNELKDVIEGVTINLLAAQDAGAKGVTLAVKQDTSAVVKAVQGMVDQYNSVMEFISTKMDKSTGELKGDGTLLRLQSSLRQMMTSRSSYTQGKYVTLSDLGIATSTWNKDAPDLAGKLSLNTAKLEEALRADPLAVKSILYKETNVAAAAQGASVSGAEYSSSYPAASVVDGVTDGTNWGNGQGWNSITSGDFSDDILTIDFDEPKTLEKLKLFTLDTTQFPASEYGVRDYEIYYDVMDDDHKIVNKVGNAQGSIAHSLDSLKASRLIIKFNDSNDHQFSRVTEIEAYENSGVLYRVEEFLDSYIRTGSGMLSEKEKSYNNQIDDINDQIERLEDRLEMRQASLVRQFTAMEKALSSMQSQGNWLGGQIAQLSNWNYNGQ